MPQNNETAIASAIGALDTSLQAASWALHCPWSVGGPAGGLGFALYAVDSNHLGLPFAQTVQDEVDKAKQAIDRALAALRGLKRSTERI